MKQFVLGALRLLGVFRLCRFLRRHQLLVLTYHGVLPRGDESDPYLDRNCVDADAFGDQLRYLSRHYTVLSLRQVEEIVRDGRPFPKYSVAITFDDGFRNNYTVAYPLLQLHRAPFAIFLTTGFIGIEHKMLWTEEIRRAVFYTERSEISLQIENSILTYPTKNKTERERASREIVGRLKSVSGETRTKCIAKLRQVLGAPRGAAGNHSQRYAFMDWDEVAEMSENGVEFGSHTVTHPIVSTLEEDEVLEEIVRSKAQIEQALNKDCRFFGYPNGAREDFGERDKALLKQSGYSCAFSQIPGFNTSTTDPFELRRMNVGRGHDFSTFVAMTTGALLLLKRMAGRDVS